MMAIHGHHPIKQAKEFRAVPGTSKDEALAKAFTPVIDWYRTSIDPTNRSADYESIKPVLHHEAARYGPDCTACGKPLRTPRAKFCAECGADR